MKIYKHVVVLMVSATIAGCVPVSLHGIQNDENTIYDPCLVGSWYNPDNTKECWVFSKGKGASYNLALSLDGQTAPFKAHLVQLGDSLFLDLFPGEPPMESHGFYYLHLFPVHSFLQVKQIGPALELMVLDLDNTQSLLETEPNLMDHEFTADRLLFTGSSEDIQCFLRTFADSDTLFKDTSVFLRQEDLEPQSCEKEGAQKPAQD